MVQVKKGGYALKEQGVTRILAEEVIQVVETIGTLTSIPLQDIHIIGSAGKQKTSGDVDIAISANQYNAERIHHNITIWLDEADYTLNTGTRVGSYAIPLLHESGADREFKVQVDIMYTDNVDLAAFTFFSPGDDSKYKGAVRTILLQAVASAMDVPGVDYFKYDDQGLLLRVGRTLDLQVGLRRIYQHRPLRKDGNGYTKTLKTVTKKEFETLYPDISVTDFDVVDSPDSIVQVLFGDDITSTDVETAEQVLTLINDTKRFSLAQMLTINKIATARLRSVADKMEIPEVLQPLHNLYN